MTKGVPTIGGLTFAYNTRFYLVRTANHATRTLLQESSPQAGSRRRYQHLRFRETRPVFPAFRMPPELAHLDPMDLELRQLA